MIIKSNTEPIGLLDSGVGGLSVLKELYKIMPNKDYIFFGDTKNLPYGTKSPEQIFSFTKEILEFFVQKKVKNVVIACNTTSALAYEQLKECFYNKLNIFPLIQLGAKDAVSNLKDGDTIAVFATRATVNSKKYTQEIRKINPKINVIETDCTGFVEIVENRLYDDIHSIEFIKSKIDAVKKYNVKKIILGCTHYPYLVNIFKKMYDVEYFNPAVFVAKAVKAQIDTPDSLNPNMSFFVSENPQAFRLSANVFFEINTDINLVDFSKNLSSI